VKTAEKYGKPIVTEEFVHDTVKSKYTFKMLAHIIVDGSLQDVNKYMLGGGEEPKGEKRKAEEETTEQPLKKAKATA
jgi:hypothetical protein